MSNFVSYFKSFCAILGVVIGWFFGEVNSLVYVLLAFMIIDYITGVICAVKDKQVSSKIGFLGVTRKLLIIVLVGIGNVIDYYVIGSGSTLKTMLILFYLSNEGISILENMTKLGLPIPEKLKTILLQINEDGDV